MWILINNKPFNINNIISVSEVLKIDKDFYEKKYKYYYKVTSKLAEFIEDKYPGYPENEEERLWQKIFEEEFYFFVISYLEPISKEIKYKVSGLYKNKDTAQTILNSLLQLMNEIYSNLPKINI